MTDAPRYPNDEFASRRLRIETHPTLASYLATRSSDELAALTSSDHYRRNVFGSYDGTSHEHASAILDEVARRAEAKCTKQLEWMHLGGPLGKLHRAETPFGAYDLFVYDKGEDDGITITFRDQHVSSIDALDLDRAKATAQADFDNRVSQSRI